MKVNVYIYIPWRLGYGALEPKLHYPERIVADKNSLLEYLTFK